MLITYGINRVRMYATPSLTAPLTRTL
jgi:hypothetical protein